MKHIGNAIYVIVMAVLILFIVSCFSGDVSIFDIEPSQVDDENLYYNQLNDIQKKFYDAMLPTIQNCEKDIAISDVKVDITTMEDDILIATIAIQYDHPEYFWFTGGCSYTFARIPFVNYGTLRIKPIYYQYVSALYNEQEEYKELDDAANKVVKLAKEHSSDGYEQIVFVHDYLIENAIYDHDGLDEYEEYNHNPECEYIFSAYGCLVNQKTVCSGYAKAFQLILRKLGYDCTYVVGSAGGAHGWNCVYLDGEGYYVDVTWDDYNFEKEIPMYNYAFITKEALNKTHKVDMKFSEPICDSTDYNYFIKRGYYTETYTFEKAYEIISKQSAQDAAYIQFGSLSEYEAAYDDLIKKGRLKEINGIGSKVMFNKKHYTMAIMK